MLIYVSGPYSSVGEIDANIEAARTVAARLWEVGHAVICPHANTAHFEKICGIPWEGYLDGDLQIIARCDAMVMLPRWEESRGAKLEYDYAEKLHIPIYIWPEYPPMHPTELRCPTQARAFAEVLGQVYRTHLDKNRDYSPLNILMTGEVGLVTRLWDKVARLLNLVGFEIDVNILARRMAPKAALHESIEDTFLDAAVYSVIGLLLHRDQWGK